VLAALAARWIARESSATAHRVVREIAGGAGGEIDASFSDQPFSAQASCAIVTLPLGVLQASPGAAGAVASCPGLDANRTAWSDSYPDPF